MRELWSRYSTTRVSFSQESSLCSSLLLLSPHVLSIFSSRLICSSSPFRMLLPHSRAPPRHAPPPRASGFLCTVQSGKKDAHRAVEEAKHLLSAVELVTPAPLHTPGAPPPPPAAHEDLFGPSLPLHQKGELGCTFLPMHLYDPERRAPDEATPPRGHNPAGP